jgi:cobalt-precorrin-5B (C1)-methyltransferase
MREGFTTGACAAAAALASCLWRKDGECPECVEIELPGGRAFRPEVRPHPGYWCGVIKDAGDDPDITDGCEVRAHVEPGDLDGPIVFLAGEGVGVVLLPGLKLPVGEAAINPAPRAMIERAVRQVLGERSAAVTVSIPGGAALAAKTFNPRLGISGGLSILGTTGIVRPMSDSALRETIQLELSVRRAAGVDALALTFGNQGEEALGRAFPAVPAAQMSNFVGFALDEAARLGFGRLLVAGHPGKLVKVAAGVMQTHNLYADARREAVIAALARMGAPWALAERVHGCATTEAMVGVIRRAGYQAVWDHLADAAAEYCEVRVRGAAEIDAAFLDGAEVLGVSGRIRRDPNRWRKGGHQHGTDGN